MGLKCSLDFAQETMENIFRDVEDTYVYIDNIGVFFNSWEHHVKLPHKRQNWIYKIKL